MLWLSMVLLGDTGGSCGAGVIVTMCESLFHCTRRGVRKPAGGGARPPGVVEVVIGMGESEGMPSYGWCVVMLSIGGDVVRLGGERGAIDAAPSPLGEGDGEV